MFVVHLKYIVPIDKVLSARPEHVVFLDQFYAKQKLVFSGRKYDQSGGVIIINSKDENEVHEIMKCDPFITNKIAEYEVIGFDPVKKSDLINFEAL